MKSMQNITHQAGLFFIGLLIIALCASCSASAPAATPDVSEAYETSPTSTEIMPTATATPEPTPTSYFPVPEGTELYTAMNPCDSPYSPAREGATWTYSYINKGTNTDQITKVIKINMVDCDEHASSITMETSDVISLTTRITQCNYDTGECSFESTRTTNAGLTIDGKTRKFTDTEKSNGNTLPATGFSIGSSLTTNGNHHSETPSSVTDYQFSRTEKILGFETITVPAGTFTALHTQVTYKTKYSDSNDENSYTMDQWSAYGIGLLKYTVFKTTQELVSYSIP